MPTMYGHSSWANFKSVGQAKLPEKIRCDTCKKLKSSKLSFSNKKLDTFINGLATGRINSSNQELPQWITCRDCVGTQKVEMTCIICHYVKGLDGFSKAQRKTPDTARCLTCMAKVDLEAPLEGNAAESALKELEGSDDDFDGLSDTETNPYTNSGLGSSVGGVPIATSSTHALNEEHLRELDLSNETASGNRTDTVASGWGRAKRDGDSDAGATERAGGRKPFMAYDRENTPPSKYTASTVADSDVSYLSNTKTNTNTQASMTAREYRDATSKWARTGNKELKPEPPKVYYGGRLVKDDSSDEGDSDDEFKTL